MSLQGGGRKALTVLPVGPTVFERIMSDPRTQANMLRGELFFN